MSIQPEQNFQQQNPMTVSPFTVQPSNQMQNPTVINPYPPQQSIQMQNPTNLNFYPPQQNYEQQIPITQVQQNVPIQYQQVQPQLIGQQQQFKCTCQHQTYQFQQAPYPYHKFEDQNQRRTGCFQKREVFCCLIFLGIIFQILYYYFMAEIFDQIQDLDNKSYRYDNHKSYNSYFSNGILEEQNLDAF